MGYHTLSPMVDIPADILSSVKDEWAQDTRTKIQTVLKRNSQSEGDTPMSVKLPVPGGGGGSIFVHIFIYKDVQ